MLKVFSVYDSKAEAFLQPFFCVNRAVAVRNFEAAAKDENSQFFRHAADYTLFEIGSFDDQTGVLEKLEAKLSMGTALEFQGERG